MKATLAKRASAKRRIGVTYPFRELMDPNDWCIKPIAAMGRCRVARSGQMRVVWCGVSRFTQAELWSYTYRPHCSEP